MEIETLFLLAHHFLVRERERERETLSSSVRLVLGVMEKTDGRLTRRRKRVRTEEREGVRRESTNQNMNVKVKNEKKMKYV